MKPEILKKRNFEHEFIFTASRSGGPGGQNVNKVNTKIELRFNVIRSELINDKEKELIFKNLKNRINSDGDLIIIAQTGRTQLRNKEEAEKRFYIIVSQALTIPKTRRSTSPTFASKQVRIEEKKRHGLVKRSRKDTGYSEDI